MTLIKQVICSILIPICWADLFERTLYKHLLDGYEKLERPTANSSDPIEIKLTVELQQIIDMDEQNQILTINAWLNYCHNVKTKKMFCHSCFSAWKDTNLYWNPEDYGGIADVRLPADIVWKPDVLLYNSVDANFDSTYQTNVVLYSSGDITWIPPGIFKIACKIDIKFFPFDEQLCFLKFGSWTYDGTKLDLQPEGPPDHGFEMQSYTESGEWFLRSELAIIETERNRTEKFYECCPEPYPTVQFYLFMRRRTLYYGFNLIIPSVLITFMTTLGFLLPPDAGEKITLQITVMLSICFFLNIVSNMTPPTSEAVPLLGVFFSSCMIIVSISVVCTVWVLNLAYRTAETHEMGRIYSPRKIPFSKKRPSSKCQNRSPTATSFQTRVLLLNWIPWCLMMERPGYDYSMKTMPHLFTVELEENSESLLRNVRGRDENDGDRHRHLSLDLEQRISRCLKLLSVTESQISLGQQAVILMLQRIYTQLKFITNRMSDQDESDVAEAEWQFAAMVVDRMCLWLLTACVVSSLVYIYFAAPYLFA